MQHHLMMQRMIKQFKHKGLKRFWETENTRGIQAEHAIKLELQLTRLNAAIQVSDMDVPGWRLHALKGDLKGVHAIDVSGNWRLTFRIEEGHAYVVNYEDYH